MYTIELNKEQLKIISNCLEMSSRIMSGQITTNTIYPFRDIIYKSENNISTELVDAHLKEVKRNLFPDLHQDAHHGSSSSEESKQIYEMYKQIEHLLQKEKEGVEGENSFNVHSSTPLKLTDKPLIVVKNSLELTRDSRIDSLLDTEEE